VEVKRDIQLAITVSKSGFLSD